METVKKKKKRQNKAALWSDSSVLTLLTLSLGHQTWDAVLAGLLLSSKVILVVWFCNRYFKQWCKQGKFLSLTWLLDTKHSCTGVSHSWEGLQATGHLHQSHSNGGEATCQELSSAFLPPFAAAYSIFDCSPQPKNSEIHISFTPELGVFHQ